MVRFAPFWSGLCGGVVVGSGGESDVAQAVGWLARWLRYESRLTGAANGPWWFGH